MVWVVVIMDVINVDLYSHSFNTYLLSMQEKKHIFSIYLKYLIAEPLSHNTEKIKLKQLGRNLQTGLMSFVFA